MFAEPHHREGRGQAWIVALAGALALLAAGAWLLLDRSTPTPVAAGSPPAASARSSPEGDNAIAPFSERPSTGSSGSRASTKAPRATETPATKAPAPTSATTSPTLRVESDLPGAMVFVNRKYLGTTPLVSRDVRAGSHELNVQVEGREPVVQTIDVATSGETRVTVEIAAGRLDARVAVVHKHGIGSCDGMLIATPAGLQYQTTHDADGFTLPFDQLETFSVDYLEKQLRVKQRGGRTWNFTTRDEKADPLHAFHRKVEAAR